MRWMHALLAILIAATPASLLAGETYNLSMLPRYSSEEINRRINPLAEYLTKKTGSKIEPVITSDFAQYEKRLKNGTIEIGYENPYIYTLVADTHEALAMAVKGKDRDKFRGIIIARADSGLATIQDLRGKTVSIVGHTSAGGYLSQKLSLMEAGVDIDTVCTITEAVENKQENVIFAVYTGEADAGFIRESALNRADKYISGSQIRVIRECAWLPNWAFSVKKTLPEKLKKDIQAAILDLKPGHPVLKALKIDSFRMAVDGDYETVRRASRAKQGR